MKLNFIKTFLLLIFSTFVLNGFADKYNPWADKKNWSPLMKATYKGKYKKMQKLLSDSIHDLQFVHALSALSIAIHEKDTTGLSILLKSNFYNYENTSDLVFYACYNSNADIIEMLIKYGYPVIEKDERVSNSLLIAVQFCDIEVIKLLLKHNVTINQKQKHIGYTPLMRAISFRKLDIVELLIKSGADISIQDSNGENAMDYFQEKLSDNISNEQIIKFKQLFDSK